MAGKKTVLVIEDDSAIRDSIRAVLARNGFEVCCCGEGITALEFSEKNCFHVVITDYHMDGLNGAAVTERLRARCPEALIIGMSGEHKDRDFLDAGADLFLQKPFPLSRLISAINEQT